MMKIRFDEKKLSQPLSEVERLPLPGEGEYEYQRGDLDPTVGVSISPKGVPKALRGPPRTIEPGHD